MGWLIVAAVLVLLCLLPVGVCASYDESGATVFARVCFVKIRLYPVAKARKRKEKNKKTEKKTAAKPHSDKKKSGGKLSEFKPLLTFVLQFLNGLRKKLRVRQLRLHLTVGGDDPADTALHYGRAWAVIGCIMHPLEDVFTIQKSDVQAFVDFSAQQTSIYVFADLRMALGSLIGLIVRYGLLAIREYYKLNHKK